MPIDTGFALFYWANILLIAKENLQFHLVIFPRKIYNNINKLHLFRKDYVVGNDNVFLSGFLRYDWIIFIACLINLMIFIITKILVNKIENTLNVSTDRISLREDETIEHKSLTPDEINKLKKNLKPINMLYTFFVNIISAFPLLGILGTVLALLAVAVGDGFEGAQDNFLTALTSTAWGVVASMLFKVVGDPFISPNIDKCNKDVESADLKRKK